MVDGGGGRGCSPLRWVGLISHSARNRARAQKQNKPVLFLPENQAKITRRKAQTPRGNHETPPTLKPRFGTPSTNRIEAHSVETCPGPENWGGLRGIRRRRGRSRPVCCCCSFRLGELFRVWMGRCGCGDWAEFIASLDGEGGYRAPPGHLTHHSGWPAAGARPAAPTKPGGFSSV